MNEPTTVLPEANGQREVQHYVERVRAALADLPSDVVDDLTLGMEADLAEMRAEMGPGAGDPLTARLGEPEVYAADLRAAAGIPAATGSRELGARDPLADLRRSWDRLRAEQGWVDETARFLLTLRPAWWVVRGYAITALILAAPFGGLRSMVPPGPGFWVGTVAAVVSVRWGLRGPVDSTRTLLVRIANVVAGLVVAWLLVGISASQSLAGAQVAPADAGPAPAYSSMSGSYDLSNLYLYDQDGKRLSNVRVFDAMGQPVDQMDQDGVDELVRVDTVGVQHQNVYPKAIRGQDAWTPSGAVGPDGAPYAPAVSLESLVPLAAPSSTATGTSTATPSANPTATATATATPGAAPTSSPAAPQPAVSGATSAASPGTR